ncbi:MAG: hypothetical protein AAGU11_04070, partial [Syntrophobacteraceae bacterium]
MKRNLCRAIALLVFFSALPCHAATYFVATTGNDSYTTTQAQNPATPWLTLTQANNFGSDGDLVHVTAGTY